MSSGERPSSAGRVSSAGSGGSGDRPGFGARLSAAVAARGPLCVGIDPHPGLLAAWGLSADVAGLERFCLGLVDAIGDRVAVLKPQSAFFEVHGSAGIAVLERVLAAGRAAGALLLLDAKRGDIGTTMAGYAQAYLADGAPLAADAVTLSPYLGFGALDPALDLAAATGRGVFVLALTSNPEGPPSQHAVRADGVSVAQAVVDAAAARNAGARPHGSVGVVVGATVGRTGVDFGRLNGPILAPGIGAQGATAADLDTVFGAARPLVLPTSSREILTAGPARPGLRDAVDRQLEAIAASARAPG